MLQHGAMHPRRRHLCASFPVANAWAHGPQAIIDPFPREHHAELVKPLRLPGGDARVVYSEAPRFAGLLRPRVCSWAARAVRKSAGGCGGGE